jgi:hypothetical protein
MSNIINFFKKLFEKKESIKKYNIDELIDYIESNGYQVINEPVINFGDISFDVIEIESGNNQVVKLERKYLK